MNKKKILKKCCTGKGGCGKGGPIADSLKKVGTGIANVAATPARVAIGAIKGAVAGGSAAGAKSLGKAVAPFKKTITPAPKPTPAAPMLRGIPARPKTIQPVPLPNKMPVKPVARGWGQELPGRSYPAVEGPGNPSWERRNPLKGAKKDILRKTIGGSVA